MAADSGRGGNPLQDYLYNILAQKLVSCILSITMKETTTTTETKPTNPERTGSRRVASSAVVKAIRKQYQPRPTLDELAARHKLSPRTVFNIVNRRYPYDK